jgi:hypothetical protein
MPSFPRDEIQGSHHPHQKKKVLVNHGTLLALISKRLLRTWALWKVTDVTISRDPSHNLISNSGVQEFYIN